MKKAASRDAEGFTPRSLLWLTGILAAVILQVVLRHDVPGYFRLLLGLLMLVTPILIGMTAGWLDWVARQRVLGVCPPGRGLGGRLRPCWPGNRS